MITVELVKRFEVDVELTRPGTCLPATYRNDAENPTFEVTIAAGQAFNAPPITVVDVDGTETEQLANEKVVCKWFPVVIRSSDGQVVATTVASFPTNGVADVLSSRILNENGSLFIAVPWRQQVRIAGAAIQSVETTANQTVIKVSQLSLCEQISQATAMQILGCLSPEQQSEILSSLFPEIRVESSEGYHWGTITGPTSLFILEDVDLVDNEGPVPGTFPVPGIIRVVGDVDSAVHANGELVITPAASGPAPSTICPAIITAYQKNLFGETGFVEGAQIAAGIFNPPPGPYAAIQQPDYAQADPFLWVLHEWPDIPGKERWRDLSNNVLTYGSSTPADNIVKELLFRRMFYVAPATVANFQAALDYAESAIFGGFDDWRIPTRDEFHLILFDKNRTFSAGTASGRVPGFASNSFSEAVTSTTNETGSTSVYALFTGGTRRTYAKAKSSSQNVILIRNF